MPHRSKPSFIAASPEIPVPRGFEGGFGLERGNKSNSSVAIHCANATGKEPNFEIAERQAALSGFVP